MKQIFRVFLLGCIILSCALAMAETANPALDAAQQMAGEIAAMTDLAAEGESCAAWIDGRTGGACALEYFEDEADAASRLEDVTAGHCCRVLGYVLRLDENLDEDAAAVYRAALTQAVGVDYVVNRNTKKFHDPACFSVEEIKDTNRSDFIGDREELIDQGYVPCKRCNP